MGRLQRDMGKLPILSETEALHETSDHGKRRIPLCEADQNFAMTIGVVQSQQWCHCCWVSYNRWQADRWQIHSVAPQEHKTQQYHISGLFMSTTSKRNGLNAGYYLIGEQLRSLCICKWGVMRSVVKDVHIVLSVISLTSALLSCVLALLDNNLITGDTPTLLPSWTERLKVLPEK